MTKFKRIWKSGFISFYRNGYVSLASTMVMIVTLLVFAAIIFISAILNSTLTTLKDKIDINVFFLQSATEAQILDFKSSLETRPEIKDITYTSKTQALTDFRSKHQNDAIILQALDEVGNNPLSASLNIKAKEVSQYEAIYEHLKERISEASYQNKNIISRINYEKIKDSINSVNKLIESARKFGGIIVLFFAFIAVLITFNTIRLAIYIFKDEVAVMRLVGASEGYVRGPFIAVGIMYGVISSVITLLLLIPILRYLTPIFGDLGTNMNLSEYYMHNFFQILLIIAGSGIILGIVSSYLAVRKYLKI